MVPSPRAVTQSAPPGSTLPRRRSPPNAPPVTGKIVSVPCGVEPMFCVADVSRLRTISGRESLGTLMSKNLVNGIDRTIRAPIAARDRHHTIQKRIGRMRCLEAWHRPEIVGRGVDHFAAPDGCDNLRRTVTQPKRS